MFDFEAFRKMADAVLEGAEKLAPYIAQAGIPGVSTVAALAGPIASVAENALDRIADGTLAASTDDTAVLSDTLVKLRALNDAEDQEADDLARAAGAKVD